MKIYSENHDLKLQDVAKIRAGYAFRKKIEHVESGVRVIQMKDVSMRYGLDTAGISRTNLPGREPSMWCEDGDILLLARGNNNFAVLVKGMRREKAVCSPHFFHMRLTDDSFDPAFLVWLINQPPLQDYFAEKSKGKSINNVSRGVLENMPLPDPQSVQQSSIMRLQRQVDSEILEFEKLIEQRRAKMNNIACDLYQADEQSSE